MAYSPLSAVPGSQAPSAARAATGHAADERHAYLIALHSVPPARAAGLRQIARLEHLRSAFHPLATEQRTRFYVGFVEVEICGRYGKSPVESDLGIIDAAKLAECFKFQNQDNRKLKFGQIARRCISALPENK
jgi:hypothetical protein